MQTDFYLTVRFLLLATGPLGKKIGYYLGTELAIYISYL